mgnify:FL=1
MTLANLGRNAARFVSTLALSSGATAALAATYNVGVGISDITGEAAEIGMFGYADPAQTTAGIHQRLRARAFVFEDPYTSKRVMLIVADVDIISQGVHQAVMKALKARFGSTYTEQNVVLTATHTHSGPGGFSHRILYSITTFGFKAKTFNAMVDGMVEAATKAHNTKSAGDVTFSQGTLTTASVNRSATAFRANNAADRAVFPNEIDPLMSVLTIRKSGAPIGAISLFPTHGTSMPPSNRLISPDNKGYAAYQWEHDVAGVRYLDNYASFVAAFAQTNAGDMSPNLNLKPGSGPTEDPFENTRIIGERQSVTARGLSGAAVSTLSGSIDYRMRYIDMSGISVGGAYTTDGQSHTTCPAALGTTFAAGSEEDGPGPDFINEGQSNPFVAFVGGLVFSPSAALKACQAPKEIFIPSGTLNPIHWTPEIMPIQVIKLGSIYLATVPGEPTIMSGYRIRRQLARTLGVDVNRVITLGYSNAYSGYITTPEEYDVQDYEGGATHFGKWTQAAYMQELDRLASDMVQGKATTNTLTPQDLSNQQVDLQPGVVLDTTPLGKKFGDVVTQPGSAYAKGNTVAVTFYTGHPRNNLRRNGTFLEVQRWTGSSWARVADDGDWSTKYKWSRQGISDALADISWTIPADASPGTYRIVHYGDARNLLGQISGFVGISRSFTVQ